MQIYSVFDTKAEAFITPFFAPTNAVAKRMFKEAAQDQNHQFHKNAEDYNLFVLGTFDENTGEIKGLEAIKSLGNALWTRSLTLTGIER